ncbi:thioesterase superfamily protein [Haloterrigena turkmenica DSM 5511]|uniref:Thioesterase superfamily protein n=1 Tax=Haloterrigena turkmenica (strain ATCC 51198 / DSM 5511 / JCM 9101 / NCIMB 13204 / VKM B-1734 / 4k) TaxID=543526 RepID=D2RV04_HALTV|nr:PaaI family thioesterase [Haloterrigena turkmenica]ADB59297.1 thioesterase superfamily protein [Haloterrigena turkmenica DSM 5511]
MPDDMRTVMEQFDDLEEVLQYFIDEHQEFLSWIGTRVDNVGDGTMTLSLPYDEKLSNTRPDTEPGERTDIHGGIAATLIDTAGGLVLRTKLDEPFGARIATINLNVNYLRPATGDLSATADVIRVGRSVGVSEITVESTTLDGETKEVATGQGAYRIFRSETE